MSFTTLFNLVNTQLTQAGSSDRITGAELRTAMQYVIDTMSKNVSIVGGVVPFNRIITYLGSSTLTSNITITKDTTDATPGCGAILRYIADGSHAPIIGGGIKKTTSSNDFVVTAGVINVMLFYFDGVDYWVTIHQEAGTSTGGGDTTAPTVVSATAIDSTHFTVVFSETVVPTAAGWSVHDVSNSINYAPASVTGSGTTWTFALGSGAIPSGDTLQLNYNDATGATVDTSGNEVANLSGFSMTNGIGGGDTTAPTVVSATLIDSTHMTIVFSETVVPTGAGWTLLNTVTSTSYTSWGTPTGSGNTWTFPLTSGTMLAGNAHTLAYSSGTGNTLDTAGNELVTFSGAATVNNIGLEDLNFTTVVGLSNIGSNVWQGSVVPAPNYGNYGLANKKLASGSDGSIEFKLAASNGKDAILAFNTSNVNEDYNSSHYEAGVFISSSDSNVYKIDGGTVTSTGTAGVVGNWYRIIRTGSVLKIQTSSDHSSWTDIVTLSFSSTADLFINANVDNVNKLYNPKGSNII